VYSRLYEEIEKGHAEAAAKNAHDLEMITKKFKELEQQELSAIEKLKVTQNSHASV